MRLAPPRLRRDARPFDRQSRIAELPFVLIPISLGIIASLLLAFILINRDHNRANHQALMKFEGKEQTLDRLIARVGNMDRKAFGAPLSRAQRASLDSPVRQLQRLGSRVAVRIVAPGGQILYSSRHDAPDSVQLNSTEKNLLLAGRDEGGVAEQASGSVSVSYVGLPVAAPVPAAILEIRRAGGIEVASTGLDLREMLLCLGLGVLVWAIIRPFVTREARARAARLYRARPGLVRAINRGIARDEFELHYQPQIDAQSGKPVAVEALLRWRRKGGIVMPGDYLPDAEASGAIAPLTHHILGIAVAQAREWRERGLPIRVSVNLSAASLTNLDVVERLRELTATHDLPKGALTTEVTETAVLDEPEQARAVLDAITELGVDVAVDDFGTGYASLLWLRLFPVSEVKIDRTFVASMEEDGEAFVAGVIRMGHDLGVRVVGEGIEDAETLGRLQELGCDIAQGFLFAKPMPAEEIPGWFEDEANGAWAPRREEMEFGEGAVELGKARSMIERTATSLGYDDEEIWDLKLAATEAVTNALDHGEPPDDGLVHLRVGTQRSEILIEVWGGLQNDGKANGASSTGGRGIAIISALVDDVELTRKAGSTMVRLSKRPRVRTEAQV